MVVVVDAKGEGRYDRLPVSPPPAVRVSPADYVERPAPGARVLIFRADPFAVAEVDPEEIARFTFGLAARRWPSLLVNDELDQATAGMQWRKGTIWLRRGFIRGRRLQLKGAVGVGQLWGTTTPHNVPVEVFDQSSEIWQFKSAGLGLRLLGEREYLRGVPSGLVESLAGDTSLPPEERGEFVRLVRGRTWDGWVYKFYPPDGRPRRA